jgi:ribosomal protein L17|tara:strand:- start:458 stop:697 length:240 start_codon:yes stop_codon:yes gene_type:complete
MSKEIKKYNRLLEQKHSLLELISLVDREIIKPTLSKGDQGRIYYERLKEIKKEHQTDLENVNKLLEELIQTNKKRCGTD